MYTVLPINEKVRKYLPIYPMTLGLRHTQKTISRPDGTRFHHFLYVSQGECSFNFNGKRKILPAGTAVFLHKTFPVDYGPFGGEAKTSWITFDGDGTNGIFEYFNAAGYAILTHKSFEPKIEELFRLVEKNAPWEALSAKTYDLALDFFTLLKKQTEPPMLEKAKAFIEGHYQEDLSVETIAKNLGISQSLLFKLFQTEERSTPIAYLRSVRIEKAGQMLIGGRLKVCQIAAACGFSNTAYFCKVFKAQTGDPPMAYRNKFLD